MPPANQTLRSIGQIFRRPIFEPTEAPGGLRETGTVAFADLIRLMAEAIADAQANLDRSSAQLVKELAETPVDIIPRVTETVDADGNVTYEHASPQQVSLLDLGVTPTFYQFSQTTVEASLDLKLVEVETTQEDRKERRFGLFADTASIRTERKLNRDVTVSSKITATLVPVPMPVRVEPARAITTPEPQGPQ